jgi:hypothetical protein
MNTQKEKLDYLMWVGGKFYTIQSFIEEARRMGVCRRVPVIPRIIAGETRIFLIHDVDETDPNIEVKTVKHKKADRDLKKYRSFTVKRKGEVTPKIFGYFVPSGLMVVGEDFKKIMSKLPDKTVIVSSSLASRVEKRGCGFLATGGIYLVDPKTMQMIFDIAHKECKEGFLRGSELQLIDPPIPVKIPRFRGLKRVNGDAILERKPVEEWWIQ